MIQDLTPFENPMDRYGIRCTLRPDDTMAAPHLLGPDWVAHYWFPTEAERDAALAEKAREHQFSREGDAPSVVYVRVERDQQGNIK